MNIALLTSDHLRHKYVANTFNKKLNLKLILTEKKRSSIEDTSKYDNIEDIVLINKHFQDRRLSEKIFFSKFSTFPINVDHYEIDRGLMSSDSTLQLLIDYQIDIIVLFGTSIIKDNILNHFQNKVINLHLGLSPYYRGSGTNFFPIVNNDYQCLGATFHLATNIVDGGDILYQFRPDNLESNDTIHSIGNKIIEEAGILFPIIVNKFISQDIIPKVQIKINNNKEYKSKDFNPENLKIAIYNLNNNFFINYLKDKKGIDALTKIVE